MILHKKILVESNWMAQAWKVANRVNMWWYVSKRLKAQYVAIKVFLKFDLFQMFFFYFYNADLGIFFIIMILFMISKYGICHVVFLREKIFYIVYDKITALCCSFKSGKRLFLETRLFSHKMFCWVKIANEIWGHNMKITSTRA